MTPPGPTPVRPRRPQWRGERNAVLVRMPVPLAEQLRAEATSRRLSLSDTAAELIRAALVRGSA